MKMIICVSILVLSSICPINAQVNDYFPLAKGITNKYSYYHIYSESGYYYEGKGFVYCTVIDSVMQGDSLIIWSIEEHDSIFVKYSSPSNPLDSTWDTGSNTYNLKESIAGNHILTNSDMKIWKFIPTNFSKGLPRYSEQNTDIIMVNIVDNNAMTGTSYYLKKNVGLYKVYSDKSVHSNSISRTYIDDFNLVSTTLNVKNEQIVLNKFSLHQNYPNPFNPSTTISFSLPSKSNITLKIYDILGNEIALLIAEELESGLHSILWNASNYSTGVYICRLRSNDQTQTNKVLLLK